ncbi:MAG: DNA polymerase/3'-5' exonuclease PolX [Candidatus Methylacidiphilales bacterium]|nr:DNA polymerase/3'-5' exonuclease PolX [Candidatus Methylacidiphilales bacterium]
MDKSAVAAIFQEIALLLELRGENPFKTRAYQNAARSLETFPGDLATLVTEDRLGEIPGLGEALREKTTLLVRDGQLPYYDQLRASFAPGLLDLLHIPGLGPKKLKALHDQLGIHDTASLQQACEDGRVAALAGFGPKTAANLLAGLAQRRAFAGQFRFGDVITRAEELIELLRTHPDVIRVSLAGSLRRGKEVVKDMDLVASSKDPAAVIDAFAGLEGVVRVVARGETKCSVVFDNGLPCDLRVVADRDFPATLLHFTGSKEANVALRQRAIARGLKLSEYGLEPDNPNQQSKIKNQKFPDESALYKALGLDFIPPELRENLGEIEAAETGRLPRLLEWTDLKGCFHNHTTASDGRNTLEEMASAAAELGLEYLGIADHSKSSVQANGLSSERLLAQVAEIHHRNKTRDDIHLFAGVECDILKDGTLDYGDDILAQLDYVVASVHSAFNQDADTMTRRIIRAVENEHVTLLGHPTGRLLLEREPYAINLDKVIDACAANGTWIELNANPFRLDMDWRYWRRARDKGVLCAINPDAHAVGQLGYLHLGARFARKGWLRREDVANTLPLREMKKKLMARGG